MISGVVHIEIIPRCLFFGQNPVFGMSAFWPKRTQNAPKTPQNAITGTVEPATCLPPTSTFTCTTKPYAYTQRIRECVIQFWLSYTSELQHVWFFPWVFTGFQVLVWPLLRPKLSNCTSGSLQRMHSCTN